jgi:hypothetical protein
MAFYEPARNEYGGEDFSGSLDGIVILAAIFFFYLGLAWICKRTCKTEASVQRFFKVFTHGPNIALLAFFLYHNPFKSFNFFMGMIGAMITSSFIFWVIREVFIHTTWQEIETIRSRLENSQMENSSNNDD